MNSKPCSPNCARATCIGAAKHKSGSGGFTLLELLVATSLGLGVMAMTLSTVLASRNLFRLDTIRTRINQDLRGTMDIIGADIRIAGENLNSSFPALMIENGGAGAPDTLILRRNLLDEVLKVCVEASPSSGNLIYFASGGAQGCVYADNTHNFDSWQAYRQEEEDLRARAYIFSTATNDGQWLDYTGEGSSGGQYWITTTGGIAGTYDVNSSAVYIMEEWRFQLAGDTLQLVIDGQTAEPFNVAFGIKDFQVRAFMADDTVKEAFDEDEDWTQLRSIEVSITGEDTFRAQPIERTLTARYFPRNILSN